MVDCKTASAANQQSARKKTSGELREDEREREREKTTAERLPIAAAPKWRKSKMLRNAKRRWRALHAGSLHLFAHFWTMVETKSKTSVWYPHNAVTVVRVRERRRKKRERGETEERLEHVFALTSLSISDRYWVKRRDYRISKLWTEVPRLLDPPLCVAACYLLRPLGENVKSREGRTRSGRATDLETREGVLSSQSRCTLFRDRY